MLLLFFSTAEAAMRFFWSR